MLNHLTTFIHFSILLKTFSVIFGTNCTCELSFLKFNIVKSKVRTTIIQERLNNLTLPKIEKEMALKLNPKGHD